MISAIITYLQDQIENNTTIDVAYRDIIPSTDELNVCAIRPLPGGFYQNTLNCTKNYSGQTFSILYRGTKDRKASLEAIESVVRILNNQSNVELTFDKITHIQGNTPSFAFVDDNSIPHYNANINVVYHKK